MFKRLKEPSTWAGLAALFQAAQMVLPPPWGVVAHAATVAAGGLAVALREGASNVAR